YALVVSAVILQTAAWVVWLYSVWKQQRHYKHQLSTISKGLLTIVIIAANIKILLQDLLVFPSLSQLAYGFRPVVIGYLHLVLLMMITLFLLAYGYMQKTLQL